MVYFCFFLLSVKLYTQGGQEFVLLRLWLQKAGVLVHTACSVIVLQISLFVTARTETGKDPSGTA